MLKSNKSGFSLVELSIVIIIIGLLFVGVSGGSKLIKSAKLNKIMRDISSVDTSFLAFLQAYDAYPGDFKDATTFWGTTGVADGDGDGKIEINDSASATGSDEVSNGLLHMQKAELIDGTFDIVIQNSSYAMKGELNSKLVLANEANSAGTSLGGFNSSLSGQNLIVLGRTNSASRNTGDAGTGSAFISPRDLYSLDSKFDDGNAVGGKISFRDETAGGGNVTPASCADGTSGVYVGSESDGCNMIYKMKIR